MCFYLPSYLGGYVITIINLIPKYIKIGLILNKLPKLCGTKSTMNNNIKSLLELS